MPPPNPLPWQVGFPDPILVESQIVDLIAASGGGSGGSGASNSRAIAQTAHGFVVGNVVYFNGVIYVKAIANATATAELVGMVSAVAGADNFTLTTGGYVSGTAQVLFPGIVYFVSTVVAGLLQSTDPSVPGLISKPCFIADSTTSGYFFNMRGLIVGAGTQSSFITKAANVDLKVAATTDILTVPAGKTFVLTDVYLVGVNIVALGAGASVEMRESGAAGVMASGTQSTTMVNNWDYVLPRSNPGRPSCAAGNKVQITVTAGATATTDICDVYLVGFYLF